MYRKLASEFFGTALLVCVVVGSGIMGSNLSNDLGIVLVINTVSTVLALALLIYLFSPVSGAHFNPVITLTQIFSRKLELRQGIAFVVAQTSGAISGAVVANLMFNQTAVALSQSFRANSGTFIGEVLATLVLVVLVGVVSIRSHERLAPILVSAWIGSAYLFTSSTAFANPAVTVGRMFTDTFAGIEPGSVPIFVVAQLIGGILGVLALQFFSEKKRKTND